MIDSGETLDTSAFKPNDRDLLLAVLIAEIKALRREIEALKRRGAIKVVPGYRGA